MLSRTFLEIATDRAQPHMIEIEQNIVEIGDIWSIFRDRLLAAVGDVGIDLNIKMVGCDLIAVLDETIRVILDRVLT